MLRERTRAPRGGVRANGSAHGGIVAPALHARLGRLEAVEGGTVALVTSPGWLDQPTPAILAASPPRATLAESVGLDVVLLPLAGQPAQAVVVGWVHAPIPAARERELCVDGRRITIVAEHEIELRCGDASLKLTADGRVLIRGKGVLTHASAVNRIRGGQVQIN